MSDDEELHYVRKTTSVHYGSLEEQERQRLARGKQGTSIGEMAIQAGIRAGNINLAAGK